MDDETFFKKTNQIKIRLYRIAFGYLGSECRAVDAVDEAIFKAYKAKNKLRQQEYFDTWMTRILINECNHELRHRKKETIMESLPEKQSELLDVLPLKEAIRKLPDELRSVIILRYFAGLTVSETAEKLYIPQGTVATRQRRALALLKLDLEEESL